MSLSLVHVIGTGGTIAGKLQPTGEVAPGLTAEDLLARVPPAATHARLSAESLFELPSSAVGFPEMLGLAHRIREVFEDPEVAGVVVTHGTATLEQTAYFLDVTLGEDRPVVVTGAMRNPTLLSDDGPVNLFHAILVAASPASRGLGPLVVFNSFVHCARDVTKRHSSDLHPYQSPEFGPLGAVDETRVFYARRPYRRLPAYLPGSITASVERIPFGAGSSDLLLRAALEAGVDGVVLEASRLDPARLELVERAMAGGTSVVMCSPYPTGRPHLGTYRHKGGESDLLERGVIYAGTPALKARVKLTVALSAGLDTSRIREWFHAEWQ